ncbi:D-sedoheptulose 7-phosphate isomerase [Mucilaginibacter sp. AW1-3]
MKDRIKNSFDEHAKLVELSLTKLADDIEKVSAIVTDSIKNGNKVLLFGNGGSAADAQHIAAELTGRFVKERRGLPAIALTTDTSALTAIANDYGFDRVFQRQVEALANSGDVLIGISTSGNSKNVLNALRAGKTKGCKIIGLSGNTGGEMTPECDVNIVVPSNVTARIQEIHILIGHILCAIVDDIIF